MENDENTPDEVIEEQEEEIVEEETAEEEEAPVEEAEESEEAVAEEETVTKEEPAPKQQEEVTLKPSEYRNFKKWERSKKPKAQPQTVSPQPNVEETVLLANGMPEELVTELKAVAEVRGTTLIKAQNDPIFIAVKDKFEKDKQKAKASMPASRGASAIKKKKDLKTPGLSREEHKAMVSNL